MVIVYWAVAFVVASAIPQFSNVNGRCKLRVIIINELISFPYGQALWVGSFQNLYDLLYFNESQRRYVSCNFHTHFLRSCTPHSLFNAMLFKGNLSILRGYMSNV